MRLICSVCERSAIDRNLSCTETNCPIDKHVILGSGQVVGDVKVIQTLQITKTHAFYEGLRQKKKVLLKVAHQDQGSRKQLINEARFLLFFAQERLKSANSWMNALKAPKDPYPGVPNLQAAFVNTRVQDFPHGQAQVNGRDIVFSVWDFVQGIPLSQYLSAIPEPWFDNVAYIIMRIAYVVDMINVGNLHAKLNPDAIWISEDNHNVLRPILMDFGLLSPASELQRNDLIWLHEHSRVAYIAPELVQSNNAEVVNYRPANPAAIDVYGLGVLLYEMLAGKPRYSYRLRSRSQIVTAIRTESDNPLLRDDIRATDRVKLLDLAKAATQNKPEKRSPNSAKSFAQHLESIVGRIPSEKRRANVAQTVWRVGLGVGIIVGVYLLLGVFISN